VRGRFPAKQILSDQKYLNELKVKEKEADERV
jgi:hypothetical protein